MKLTVLRIFIFGPSFCYIVPPQIHTPKSPTCMSLWSIEVSIIRVTLADHSVQHTCHFDLSVPNILVTWTTIGRAVAATFGCRLLTITIQLADRLYGTCIGLPGTRFCPSYLVSPVVIFPPRLHFIHLIRVLENGTAKLRSTTACLIASRNNNR